MKRGVPLFCFLFTLCFTFAQELSQTVRGRVIDKVTLQPLEGVNIVIGDLNIQTTTDGQGMFRLEAVPLGRYNLQVSHTSYNSRILSILVTTGKETVLEISLTESMITLQEVVIKDRSRMTRSERIGVTEVSMEETNRIPANFFDPVRVATSLPGIVAANDQANHLVVRGSSPNTVKWRLEGMTVVNPNHQTNAGTFSDLPQTAGGGVNILSGQMLGATRITTTPYDGSLGNGLSFFDMNFREGNRERPETTIQASVIGFDIAHERPVGKGSFLGNYRYSFVGLLTGLGADFGGESISFQDLAFHYSLPTRKGKFKVFGFGGLSRNQFESFDPNDWEVDKDSQDIEYFGKTGGMGTSYEISGSSTSSFRFASLWSYSSQQRTYLENGELPPFALSNGNTTMIDQSVLSSRVEYRQKLAKGFFTAGLLNDLHLYNWARDFTTESGSNNLPSLRFRLTGTNIQPYLEGRFQLGKKLVWEGILRYNYFSYNNKGRLEPRTYLSWFVNAKSYFSIGYAENSMIQPFFYNIDFLNPDNTELDLSYSRMANLVYHLDLSNNLSLKSEVYYQYQNDFSEDSSVGLYAVNLFDEFILADWENTGRARTYGMELTMEKRIDHGFYFLGGTSYYQSEYYALFSGERRWEGTRFNGNYTINFTMGGEKIRQKPSKSVGFNYNFRILYLGGFGEPPINEGLSDFTNSTMFIYQLGYINRLEDYFRMDASVSWRINRNNRATSFGMDIQNLTGRENQSGSYYDNRSGQIIMRRQLGLIPVLFYRIEF